MRKKHASKKSKNLLTPRNESKAKLNFLDFPPEIRNHIYKYAFVKPTNIGARSMPNVGADGYVYDRPVVRTQQFFQDAASWRKLEFATVCRQVYIESSYIFFAGNGFEFFYIRPLLEFFEGIGLRARMLLTKIRFWYGMVGSPLVALRYLKSCQNLKQLDIYLGGSYHQVGSVCWWGVPLKDSISLFLGNHTVIMFGEGRRFTAGAHFLDRQSRRPPPDDKDRLGPSLTEALKKIKDGDDGRYKGRELPNVFADDGRSLVYRRAATHAKKKQSEDPLKS